LTTALIVLACTQSLILLAVIAALLRQLNKERAERAGLMATYAQLAHRVRLAQLADEGPGGADAFARYLAQRTVQDDDTGRDVVSTNAETEGL
jgi:choline-glycine betaine transporter